MVCGFIADKFTAHFMVRPRLTFQQAHRDALSCQKNCRCRTRWPTADDDRLVIHQCPAVFAAEFFAAGSFSQSSLSQERHRRKGKNHWMRTRPLSPASLIRRCQSATLNARATDTAASLLINRLRLNNAVAPLM